MDISYQIEEACRLGDFTAIASAVRSGFPVDAPLNDQGETMLIKSIYYGQTELAVSLLQELGASPDKAMYNGRTPMITAAGTGDLTIFFALLGAGANIDAQMRNGATALMYAAQKKQDSLCVYLLAMGADPSVKDKDGWTAFEYAAMNGQQRHFADLLEATDEVVQLLQMSDPHASPNYVGSVNGWPLIVLMAKYGHVLGLATCLRAGASPDAQNPAGASALNFACKYQHPDCVRLLINAGADVNQQSRGGRTPLMMAVKYDATGDIVEMLLNNGADPSIRSSFDGRTAYYFAEMIPDDQSFSMIRRRMFSLLGMEYR